MKQIFTTLTSMAAMACALAAAQPACAQNAADAAQPSAAAASQDGVIVVTAQRRAEKSRDVPITITTINANQLATANVTTLSGIAQLTPGLRFDAAGAAVQPTIRGVGTAISTAGGGPNVGIYVDGFFQPNTYTTDFNLMRVENIQVLKGPQGTLFGRNTTGGAILVTSADPSATTSEEARISYGRFNTLNLQAYVTTGLTRDIAWDIEGNYRRSDGYATNVLNGDDKVGKSHSWSIRTGIKAQITPDVSLLLRYFHSESSDPTALDVNAYVDPGSAGFFKPVSAAGLATYDRQSSTGLPLIQLGGTTGAYGPIPGSYTTAPGQVALPYPVSFHSRSDAVQATLKADLGFANLTSYTQYRFDRTPSYENLDQTALNLMYININAYDATFSQEFLLNSKPDPRLQWTVGANFFQYIDSWGDLSVEGQSPASAAGFPDLTAAQSAVFQAAANGAYVPFGGSSVKTQSIAAFANITYAFIPDRLFLTLGGRFSHDIVTDAWFKSNEFTPLTGYTDAGGNNVPWGGPTGYTAYDAAFNPIYYHVPSLKNNSFTPRVVLRYKPDALSSVYASYTRGYKAGILNVGGTSFQTVAPETNDAYEVGYKYETRRIGIDLAGFLYNYRNLQVSSFQSAAAQIRNAASARIYGIDAQAHYQVDSHLNLNAGVTWLHARYRSFTNAPYYSYCDPNLTPYTSPLACASSAGSIVQTSTNASGYHMQRSPDWSGNVGASYGFDLARGRATLSGNLYFTSSFYFDPEQQFKQSGYASLSLHAQWIDPSKRYTLGIYAENVTDKRYLTQVLFNTMGIGAVWNSPTTYGASLGYKF